MTGVDQAGQEQLVIVARAVRTRGLKGELVAELLTDFPERFENLSTLWSVGPDGKSTSFDLQSFWFQNDRVVLKFAGFDSVDTAKGLVGRQFGIPETDRVQLAENEFYDWELSGCVVEIAGSKSIGQVRDVLRTGGVALLVIVDDTGREHLVPMAESIVLNIDTAARKILIDPPEGLLDL